MKKLNLQNLSRPEAFQTGTSKLVRKTVLELIHEVKEPILDACCGNGIFLLEYCSSVNYYTDIFGVDLDLDALETAEQLFIDNDLEPPDFMQHDVLEMPFEKEKFNTIFCLNTLVNIHPFDKIEQIISELFCLLKSDGNLYIDFRNKSNPVINARYKKNIKTKTLSTFAHNKSDFDNILKKIGAKSHRFAPIGCKVPFVAKGYLLIIRK